MGEFQDDALREISRRLPCVADRDDAADVCRRWRAALSEPLLLPWLLLPSADSTRACCLFCGTGNDACVIRHKLTATHGARCFGSYNGAWVFLARGQIRRHAVVNIRDHCPNRDARFLYLPDALATSLNHGQRDMVILAATLSCSPDDQNCVGAGIVMHWQFIAGQRQVAFWRMGDPVAMALDADDICRPALEVEDVLFYNGSFRFLTQGGHIRICTPVVNQTKGLQCVSSSLCLFQGRERHSQPVMARYLVQSRGSLLMVVRYGIQHSSQLPTNGFKVYEMMEKSVSKDGTSRVEYTWKELQCLGGRMLFVGRGCSRCYDVAKYPQSGVEGVYFTDDGAFNDTVMLLRGTDDRKYPCSDNGLWLESETPNVQRCYPVQGPSKTSSPIWLLP